MMSLTNILRSLFALVLLAGAAGCDFGSSTPTGPDQSAVTYSQTDLTVGTGAEATPGTTANVQYAIWLYSDTGVDKKGTQLNPGQFSYVVGSTGVIKGFDMGVTGMKVGGIRRIVVPPSLAYGTTGNQDGSIKPNAALVFEIGLAGIQ
jgi:FKBP-type peptidyl-prolyl cis-trans isomerase FkpA